MSVTMKTEFKEVEDVVDIGIGDIIVSVIATWDEISTSELWSPMSGHWQCGQYLKYVTR